MAWRGGAWLGKARHGMAGLGEAWLGAARQGKDNILVKKLRRWDE